MSLAKGVLETIPDNSQDNIGNGWAEWPNGAPLILANGTFANPMNSTSFELTSDNFFNTIAGGAINQCWQMDSVFLAKAASKTGPGGFNPKTMDLNSLDKYNRVCDAHICYFFVKAQPVSKMGNWNEWKNAQGMDKLGNYKIDALEFAKAADHWQSKYGSYIKVPDDPSDFLEYFRDPNGPPGGLFINLPVVTYDDCPNITSMDAYKHTDEAWFLTRLGKCLNHLHGWPSSYPKMSVGKFSWIEFAHWTRIEETMNMTLYINIP